MKVYDYKERTIVELDDGSRCNYSKSGKYGQLQQMVVGQCVELGTKIGNPYLVINSSIAMLVWSNRLQKIQPVLIDYDDWLKFRHLYWYVSLNGYAITTNKEKIDFHKSTSKKIGLHNLIMNKLIDMKTVIDHINHNPCDNRKGNLRVATFSENVKNKKAGSFPNRHNLPTGITKRKTFYEVRTRGDGYKEIRKTFPLNQLQEAELYNSRIRGENGYLV